MTQTAITQKNGLYQVHADGEQLSKHGSAWDAKEAAKKAIKSGQNAKVMKWSNDSGRYELDENQTQRAQEAAGTVATRRNEQAILVGKELAVSLNDLLKTMRSKDGNVDAATALFVTDLQNFISEAGIDF